MQIYEQNYFLTWTIRKLIWQHWMATITGQEWKHCNKLMLWFVIQLQVWWSLFGKKWLSKSQDIHIYSCQGMAKNSACFNIWSKNGTTLQNYSLDLWPYLSITVELRHGSCAKMISWTWQFQPCPQWCVMMIITFFEIWTLIFCPHTFCIGCFACLKCAR